MKRFSAILLSMAMVFSLTLNVFAIHDHDHCGETGKPLSELLQEEVTIKEIDGFTVTEAKPLDLSKFDPDCIYEFPVQAEAPETSGESGDTLPDEPLPEFPLSVLDGATSLNPSNGRRMLRASAAPYQLATVSDVMPADGSQQVYTINVADGSIIQAELCIPENLSLDYTLYLCELNEDQTGVNVLSYSAYVTTSDFLSECAAAINNSGDTKLYVIIIDPNGNGSTTDYYTLRVSMGGEHDNFEPNDSAFSAIGFPSMTVSQSLTVPANLNSPIDSDWFQLTLPSNPDYSTLNISNIPANVIVESYIFNGLQPTKTGSTVNGNTLPVSAGANFFRVFYDPTHAFSPISYAEMTFAPSQPLSVEKVTFLIAVNGYCQRQSNLFADRITRFLFVRGATVEVHVGYMTNDGVLVPTNDTVTVTIDNPQWDSPNMRYVSNSGSVQNGSYCHVSLEVPKIRGVDAKYNFVYTTIVSQNYGTLVDYVQMALLDKYDNGELSKPCRHNGACGLL